jgi:hypothetical protein
VKNYSFQVTPEDIFDKGKFDLLKTFQVTDHLALIEKFSSFCTKDTLFGLSEPRKNASEKNRKEYETLLAARTNNLGRYFQLVPSEISMKLLDVVAKCGAQAVIKLHGVKGVEDYLAKILTAEGADKLVEGLNKKEEK